MVGQQLSTTSPYMVVAYFIYWPKPWKWGNIGNDEKTIHEYCNPNGFIDDKEKWINFVKDSNDTDKRYKPWSE